MRGSIWLAVAVQAAEDVGEGCLGIDRIEFAGLNQGGDQAH
jgi:hypothetical protein